MPWKRARGWRAEERTCFQRCTISSFPRSRAFLSAFLSCAFVRWGVAATRRICLGCPSVWPSVSCASAFTLWMELELASTSTSAATSAPAAATAPTPGSASVPALPPNRGWRGTPRGSVGLQLVHTSEQSAAGTARTPQAETAQEGARSKPKARPVVTLARHVVSLSPDTPRGSLTGPTSPQEVDGADVDEADAIALEADASSVDAASEEPRDEA